VVATLPAGTTAQRDTGLAASTAYYYRVSAVNAAGSSAYSNTATAATSAPPVTTTFARDTFGRTVPNGLGSAEVGGLWSWTGSSSNLAVGGGAATIRLAAGAGTYVTLPQAVAPTVDAQVTLAPDKAATGSGIYLSLIGRRTTGGDYRAKLRIQSTGAVTLVLVRVSAAGAETALTSEVAVPGVTFAVGDRIHLRLQVTGSSPTALRARAWKDGTTEPTTWLLTATDSTAGLQTPGYLGLFAYLSSGATNAPVTIAMDDLLATTW
jgi:hypothetical protein